ncbi:DUF6233 domain-containing protein [Streptomyces sp. NPDC046275]|uniref:DUF6233 domain-containing protein n=1 Tax=Streptomyces sp. NPDC046275 TaxID=3157201 RepID=UPI0033FD8AD1
MVPRRLPETATVAHAFERDMLDPVLLRAALLDLATTLAERLRARGQIAGGLTLAVRLAGGGGVEKTRRLPTPSAHTDDLRTVLWQIWDAMAYQRARIRLPEDLDRLRILERLAEIILRDIRIKIAEAEKRVAAMRPVRERHEVQWVLSYLREGGRSVADRIHASGCGMASSHTKPLTQDQALQLLSSRRVPACEICRPDTDLGVLD